MTLADRRRALGLTLADVAAMLAVSVATAARWERREDYVLRDLLGRLDVARAAALGLADRRRALGLTQADVAVQLGVPPAVVSALEHRVAERYAALLDHREEAQ